MAKTVAKKTEKKEEPIDFRPVVFFDTSSEEQFLVSSSVKTTETTKYTDGKEYPLYRVEISSASHPFYTGKEAGFKKAGRAEKFRAKVAGAKKTDK